jgi:hypothetical protein
LLKSVANIKKIIYVSSVANPLLNLATELSVAKFRCKYPLFLVVSKLSMISASVTKGNVLCFVSGFMDWIQSALRHNQKEGVKLWLPELTNTLILPDDI